MSTTTGTETRAQAYLAEVRSHLAGLTDDERDDLLDDLAAHVHQVAADDERPLEESLGPPEDFATELLASAGLTAEPPAPKPGPVARARGWIDAAIEAVRRQPAGRAVLDFLPELRPAWWVMRAWLLVYLVTLVASGDSATDSFPFPEVFGSWVLGAVAVAVAAVLSVRFGRRRPAIRGRWLVNGAAIGAGVLLVGAVNDAQAFYVETDGAEVVHDSTFVPEPGLQHSDGAPISNIYAYDANGQPLDRVRLYDQDGRPIEVYPGFDANGRALVTEPVVGADGQDVINAYPQHQSTASRFPGDPAGSVAVPPPVVGVAPLPSTSTTVPVPVP